VKSANVAMKAEVRIMCVSAEVEWYQGNVGGHGVFHGRSRY